MVYANSEYRRNSENGDITRNTETALSEHAHEDEINTFKYITCFTFVSYYRDIKDYELFIFDVINSLFR